MLHSKQKLALKSTSYLLRIAVTDGENMPGCALATYSHHSLVLVVWIVSWWRRGGSSLSFSRFSRRIDSGHFLLLLIHLGLEGSDRGVVLLEELLDDILTELGTSRPR